MASGHMPPDVSGRIFAALEPLCTRLDSAILRPVDFAASVRSRLLPSILIGASGHFPPAFGPASGHFCELVSS